MGRGVGSRNNAHLRMLTVTNTNPHFKGPNPRRDGSTNTKRMSGRVTGNIDYGKEARERGQFCTRHKALMWWERTTRVQARKERK
jgi:hypothetical protein